MPSDWLYIDTNFPTFTGEEKMDEKVSTIQNYLFMLVEQLRYTLHNLDLSNMNSTAVSQYSETLTEPIYARIEDDEGNLAQLQATAAGLAGRISDAEGNITQLSATAAGLAGQISDIQGNVTQLGVTAAGLASRVSDVEGNVSTLQQTAQGLAGQVSDLQGDVSSVALTAQGLASRVSGAEGNISALTQTVNGFGLSVTNGTNSSRISLTSNGVAVDSAQISFSGMVTYTDLSTAGATTIYGGNVSTDSLKVSNLYGQYVYLRNSAGTAQGCITITSATTASSAVDITSYGALRLTASSGALYLTNGFSQAYLGTAYRAWFVQNCLPVADNAWNCGSAGYRWANIYATNTVIQTSDRNQKHDIEPLPDKYLDMLLELPVYRFKMNGGTSDRYHVGYIAQDVEEYMDKHGIDSLEFGGFVKDVDKDGNEIYMLRYAEFIAIHTLAVQRIYQKLEAAG